MILTTGDDGFFISTCPPEFDPDSLKKNDGASFNCICRLPSVRSCPKSVLEFKCLQEKGWLFAKMVFSCGIFLNFKVIPSTKTILIALVGPCHTSVLCYECLQERGDYLQKLFSCKIFGISKSLQAQKPF